MRIPYLRRTWRMDYARDHAGLFNVTCPYCRWAAIASTLSSAVAESKAHQHRCEGNT